MGRNYWNTIGASSFPTSPRLESIPVFNEKRELVGIPSDPWWINSKKDHFCFWTLIKNRSNSEGYFDPLMHGDIAHLLGLPSNTKVFFVLKEAMDALKEVLITEEPDLFNT